MNRMKAEEWAEKLARHMVRKQALAVHSAPELFLAREEEAVAGAWLAIRREGLEAEVKKALPAAHRREVIRRLAEERAERTRLHDLQIAVEEHICYLEESGPSGSAKKLGKDWEVFKTNLSSDTPTVVRCLEALRELLADALLDLERQFERQMGL